MSVPYTLSWTRCLEKGFWFLKVGSFSRSFWKTQEWPFCFPEGTQAAAWAAGYTSVSHKKEQDFYQKVPASDVLTSSVCQEQL